MVETLSEAKARRGDLILPPPPRQFAIDNRLFAGPSRFGSKTIRNDSPMKGRQLRGSIRSASVDHQWCSSVASFKIAARAVTGARWAMSGGGGGSRSSGESVGEANAFVGGDAGGGAEGRSGRLCLVAGGSADRGGSAIVTRGAATLPRPGSPPEPPRSIQRWGAGVAIGDKGLAPSVWRRFSGRREWGLLMTDRCPSRSGDDSEEGGVSSRGLGCTVPAARAGERPGGFSCWWEVTRHRPLRTVQPPASERPNPRYCPTPRDSRASTSSLLELYTSQDSSLLLFIGLPNSRYSHASLLDLYTYPDQERDQHFAATLAKRRIFSKMAFEGQILTSSHRNWMWIKINMYVQRVQELHECVTKVFNFWVGKELGKMIDEGGVKNGLIGRTRPLRTVRNYMKPSDYGSCTYGWF
ncbi:hypothetical protein B0H13DRAFT_1890787 [Mycena leptocephala]|nr:hypothetical protein B0H13DRAFT_1890787 [Mycena leptocephala]